MIFVTRKRSSIELHVSRKAESIRRLFWLDYPGTVWRMKQRNLFYCHAVFFVSAYALHTVASSLFRLTIGRDFFFVKTSEYVFKVKASEKVMDQKKVKDLLTLLSTPEKRGSKVSRRWGNIEKTEKVFWKMNKIHFSGWQNGLGCG